MRAAGADPAREGRARAGDVRQHRGARAARRLRRAPAAHARGGRRRRRDGAQPRPARRPLAGSGAAARRGRARGGRVAGLGAAHRARDALRPHVGAAARRPRVRLDGRLRRVQAAGDAEAQVRLPLPIEGRGTGSHGARAGAPEGRPERHAARRCDRARPRGGRDARAQAAQRGDVHRDRRAGRRRGPVGIDRLVDAHAADRRAARHGGDTHARLPQPSAAAAAWRRARRGRR